MIRNSTSHFSFHFLAKFLFLNHQNLFKVIIYSNLIKLNKKLNIKNRFIIILKNL